MTGKTDRRRIRLGAGIILTVTSACAPTIMHRQTQAMEKSGTVGVSAAELRAEVNDLADLLTGVIEETADKVLAETRDPAIRRQALVLKVDAIPAVYTAAYHTDPLAAVADVWALAFQAGHYVEDGAARDVFGPQQHLVREGARQMLAYADATVRRIARTPEACERARVRVDDWAKQHPIETTLATRSSIVAFAARLRAEGQDAFLAVGEVSETIENVSERLNTYAAQLPRQARWHAELLAADMAESGDVEEMMGDVHAVGSAARRAHEILDDVPGFVGPAASPLREVLAAERRAALEGVNGQRVHTLEYVTAERQALLAALHQERIAVATALHQERIETLKEVDAIRSRAVDSTMAGLRDVVDHALWSVAALLVLLLTTAAVLSVVVYRLTIGRHVPTAG